MQNDADSDADSGTGPVAARVKVDFADLETAVELVSASGQTGSDVRACVSRVDGRVYVDSSAFGEENELPDDCDDPQRFVDVPSRRDLDLGTELAFDFARQRLPQESAEVRHLFSRRGGWSRFKDLLDRRGLLQEWYAFQSQAELHALHAWAADHAFALVGAPELGASSPTQQK